MNPALIEFRGISKSFGGNVVLRDVTLKLEQGRFYALLGKNGAGKSTLMKILMRYEQPDKGESWIFDKPLSGDFGEINREIGYVSESLDFALPLKIRELFKHWATAFPKWEQRVFDDFLAKLRVDQDKYFKELSRGQKMQVAFAAAAAIKPRLIVLDEITAVLDAAARQLVMNYLGAFAREGGTVIMATNIVSEVQHYADHLILIDDGKILFDKPLADVSKTFRKLRKPQGQEHEIFRDPSCVEVGLNSDGSLSYLIDGAAASRHTLTHELDDKRGVTAEEIFIYHTRKRGNE